MTIIPDEIFAQFRRYMELLEEKEQTAVAAKRAKSEWEEAEQDLQELMAESGVEGALKLDLGEPWGVVSFTRRETYYASIYDKEAAAEYFRELGMEQEVKEPTISKQRANEEVRRLIEENQSAEIGSVLPEGISFYVDRGVTVKRQKK